MQQLLDYPLGVIAYWLALIGGAIALTVMVACILIYLIDLTIHAGKEN